MIASSTILVDEQTTPSSAFALLKGYQQCFRHEFRSQSASGGDD